MNDSAVPFFAGAASVRRQWPTLAPRLRRIAESGVFVAGPAVRELEERVREYVGARHAVACNNASDALILMLRAAGIGRGDEVLVPAYSFFATASCVLHAGAQPVFVDVVPGSYAMDPAAAEAAIGPRTRAIMAVHLFSQTADLVALREVADRHGLTFVEDSAEAIGMRVAGRHAGLWGRAGVLSFFPTKTLGALGDAGMVVTDDRVVADAVRRMVVGGCDEVQAAVLLARLETLDADIARRAELVDRYDRMLAPLAPAVRTPSVAPAREPSNLVWYVYLIETDRRDELAAHLTAHGVGTEIYYPRPLPAQPCLRDLPGSRRPVPVAAAAADRALALPLYPDLTEAQVDHVCDLVRTCHGSIR